MGFCRAVTAVVVSNLCRWKKGVRVRFIFLCMCLLIIYDLMPVLSYGLDYGRTVPLFMLPMLFGSSTISLASPKMLIYVGLLCMLCDVPFSYPLKPYLIQRSGKTALCTGDCIYILIVSLIYLLFLTIVSTVVILPIASFQDTYSGVLTDMELGTGQIDVRQIVVVYPHIPFPSRVIKMLYPSGAQVYTFLAAWLSFILLGLMMYWISLLTNRSTLGLVFAGLFVFLDPVLVWASWPNRYWLMALSPVCWSSVEQLDLFGADRFISIPIVLMEGSVLLLFFYAASMLLMKRKNIGSM